MCVRLFAVMLVQIFCYLFHFSAALTELAFPNLSIYTEAYVP